MTMVHVSFFSGLSVDTKTRHCSFPHLPKAALTGMIAGAMKSDEFFACYRGRDGVVVALDKDGFCVTY